MQGSTLQGKYFKVIGLIDVSRLIVKGSRVQLLALEEINLSKQNKDFINKKLEELEALD